MIKTFRIGGIHAPENKLSAGQWPQTLPLPEQVVIPLSQHIGAPARPVVAKGDEVKVGTLIAEAAGFVSASIHSPVSGVVAKIDEVVDASGYKKPAILIDVKDDVWEDFILRDEDMPSAFPVFSSQEIIDKIRQAGIVGMGGAAFPTHVKLTPPPGHQADVLIINAAECEPYLTNDHALMLAHGPEILQGIQWLMQAAQVQRAIIGIENNKPDVIAYFSELLALPQNRAVLSEKGAVLPEKGAIRSEKGAILSEKGAVLSEKGAIRSEKGTIRSENCAIHPTNCAIHPANGAYSGIEIACLKPRYPQGSEKQLIDAIIGRQVASGALPISVGAIVQNVATAFAVYEAVAKNKPLVERIVTLTGKRLASPSNLRVRLGTPIRSLIEFAGGLPEDTGKIIGGGPMMGRAWLHADVPVTKGVSGVLLLPAEEARRKPMRNCIRCSKCVEVCCMGLEPYLLMNLAEFKEWTEMQQNHVMDCLECGSCSYVCPANRPILDHVKWGKAELRAAAAK
jgi:Na+-translocating ferredoxin:NAD+ oxidoreductase RnfC subunit